MKIQLNLFPVLKGEPTLKKIKKNQNIHLTEATLRVIAILYFMTALLHLFFPSLIFFALSPILFIGISIALAVDFIRRAYLGILGSGKNDIWSMIFGCLGIAIITVQLFQKWLGIIWLSVIAAIISILSIYSIAIIAYNFALFDESKMPCSAYEDNNQAEN